MANISELRVGNRVTLPGRNDVPEIVISAIRDGRIEVRSYQEVHQWFLPGEVEKVQDAEGDTDADAG